jgi:UDP-galactose transporter B1
VKQFDLDPYKRWIGYVLLLIAVVCDALFSDNQAYCKATFKPTPNQLFLAANLYGFMFIFTFSILIGEFRTSIIFCLKHPIILIELILIGCLQVIGQISVYYVISNFKQHIYPLISTTRKIFTILVSIVAFNHKLNLDQWFALAIVFLSMAY